MGKSTLYHLLLKGLLYAYSQTCIQQSLLGQSKTYQVTASLRSFDTVRVCLDLHITVYERRFNCKTWWLLCHGGVFL